MADDLVPGFWKYWTQELPSLKSAYHAIMSKCPEAEVYKTLSDTENRAGGTKAKVKE
jgi:hypothetical protein